MTLDSFLAFWSAHNTQIIEVLIGLILLMVVYLAFRSFFGEEGSAFAAPEGQGSAGLDAAQLEKTLQKILENQSSAPAAAAPAAVDPAAAAEVEKLKGEVASRDAQIEELKKSLATSSSSATLGGGGEEEKKKAEEKVKDLEARLAEYEIISEDIADLSFYKEENSKLQKELEALRNAAPPAAPEPVPAEVISQLVEATSAPAPIPDAVADLQPAVAAEPAPEAMPEAPAAAAVTDPAVATEAAAAPADTAAAAVAASTEAPKEEPATVTEKLNTSTDTPAEERPPTAEESQLMNQFENFVKKG